MEHFIQFSMSLRGKPAILGDFYTLNKKNHYKYSTNLLKVNNIRFIVMTENTKRVLWRCSLMSTKTRKCPARIVMFKGNPPRFVMGHCRHEHMELTRGNSNQELSVITVGKLNIFN